MILYLLFTTLFGFNLNDTKNIYTAYLAKVKSFDKSTISSNQKMTIHFFWTQKCDFCFDGYAALATLKKEYSPNEVIVKSYFVSELKNTDLKKEIAKMPAFNHIAIETSQLNPPKTLQRYPVFMIENNLNNELELYTGYSDERYRYIKNLIYQKVRPQGGIK